LFLLLSCYLVVVVLVLLTHAVLSFFSEP